MICRAGSAAYVLAWVTLVSASALAGTEDDALAEALFIDGRRAMSEGRVDEACPKLAESQRLDPTGGTALLLALCLEKQGKLASAWAAFANALAFAKRDHAPDREALAAAHLARLELRVSRVRLDVDPDATAARGAVVRRDGAVLAPAAWTVPIPLDPGSHVFELSAPGRATTTVTAHITEEGASVPVVLRLAPVEATATPPPREAQRSRPLLGFALAGTAVALFGAGTYLGLSARSGMRDVRALCPTSPCSDASAEAKRDDAKTRADLSTAAFVIGAGFAVGSAWVFVAADGRASSIATGGTF